MLHRIEVPGYASIIVAVMILGGLQLLATGIIGEYLGRVHLNLNRKPQYTVRTILAPAASPDVATEGKVPNSECRTQQASRSLAGQTTNSVES